MGSAVSSRSNYGLDHRHGFIIVAYSDYPLMLSMAQHFREIVSHAICTQRMRC